MGGKSGRCFKELKVWLRACLYSGHYCLDGEIKVENNYGVSDGISLQFTAVHFTERSDSTNIPCWKTRGVLKCRSCLSLSIILAEDMT